jgi:CRP/FNR family transcriptional regulator
MKSTSAPKSKVGSGRNITNRNERTFKRGALMFIEGETSTEMFIIRSGKVRILKQEGDKALELAVLGPGSVLGELSLLDHQPRSATAQVVEDVIATVIDESLLDQTLQAAPGWLSNIIQVVVSRFRNTMKRTADSIVENSIGGVIRILLLLLDAEGEEQNGEMRVRLERAKQAINGAIGIGDIETENVFLHLTLKEMMVIRKSDAGREYVVIREPEVMRMYMQYLRARARGGRIPGEGMSQEAIALVGAILSAGEKHGRCLKHTIYRLSVAQVAIEQERAGGSHHVDPNVLDVLTDQKAVLVEKSQTKTTHGTHRHDVIIYNKDTLQRILSLQKWLAVFEEKVIF